MIMLKFDIGNRTFSLSFRTHKKLTEEMHGITNRCIDGKYVIFLDYDHVSLDWIVGEIEYIQKKHKLGTFHFFETQKGYHVICCDKLQLKELLSVMDDTSIDNAFFKVPLHRAKRNWTLRITKKDGEEIKYIASKSARSKRIISSPHQNFISARYGIPKDKRKKEDGQKDFYISKYQVAPEWSPTLKNYSRT